MIADYFLNRHTVREFSDKEVDAALLRRILTAAVQAPTTGNMQLYSIVVTRDTAVLAKLREAHFNQPAAVNAPMQVTFCADFNRFEKWCRLRDARPGFGNFQSFVAAMLDTVAVAQQFVTIAEMCGLGTCYLGTATYNAPLIAKALRLPSRVVPVAAISVGYPLDTDKPGPTSRLPIDAVIHSDTYHDYSDNDIADAYRPLESLPQSERFVAENGKSSLAQVFTDVRYPQEASDSFSRLYMEFIADAGFRFPC